MQNVELLPKLIKLQASDLLSLHDLISVILKIPLQVSYRIF